MTVPDKYTYVGYGHLAWIVNRAQMILFFVVVVFVVDSVTSVDRSFAPESSKLDEKSRVERKQNGRSLELSNENSAANAA